jgi:hypothetical protein
MKKTIFLIILVTLFLNSGCDKGVEPNTSYIFVNFEIESAFQNDYVIFALDRKVLLDSRVTTNYTIGLAWSSGLLKISKDNHIVHFSVVEYGVQKDYRVGTLNDTSTVLLRFDKSTKQIILEQFKGIILRD